jgi:hypothetical protein
MFNQSEMRLRSYFWIILKKCIPGSPMNNIKFAGVAQAKHVITVAN